jgi:hypothetical protein
LEVHVAEVALGVGISLIGSLPVRPHGLTKSPFPHLTFLKRDAKAVLGAGMPLLCCVLPHANHLVHLTLLGLGQRAPRRFPAIHPPFHVEVSPKRLLLLAVSVHPLLRWIELERASDWPAPSATKLNIPREAPADQH